MHGMHFTKVLNAQLGWEAFVFFFLKIYPGFPVLSMSEVVLCLNFTTARDAYEITTAAL